MPAPGRKSPVFSRLLLLSGGVVGSTVSRISLVGIRPLVHSHTRAENNAPVTAFDTFLPAHSRRLLETIRNSDEGAAALLQQAYHLCVAHVSLRRTDPDVPAPAGTAMYVEPMFYLNEQASCLFASRFRQPLLSNDRPDWRLTAVCAEIHDPALDGAAISMTVASETRDWQRTSDHVPVIADFEVE